MDMNYFSKEDFIELIKQKGKIKHDYEIVINDKVIINEESVGEFKSIEIDNVKFYNDVVVENLRTLNQLYFSNCLFNKSILLREVEFKSITIKNVMYPHNIRFDNCRINFFSSSNLKIKGRITFNECDIRDLIHTNEESDIARFNIEKCKIVSVYLCKLKSNINISGNIIKTLRVEDITNKELYITENEIERARFLGLRDNNLIAIKSNVISDSFIFEGCCVYHLFFDRNKFFGNSLIRFSKDNNCDKVNHFDIYNLELLSCEINGQFNVYGDYEDAKIENLKLELLYNSIGSINLTNIKIDKILMLGINNNLNCLFRNISSKSVNFENFANSSDISFSNLRGVADSEINIHNSDLGPTRFNDVDFNSFKSISIINSILYKIITSNVIWFSESKLIVEGENELKTIRNKREIYRQLKHSLKNNSNQIESLNFHSLELKAFDRELSLSNNSDWKNKFIMAVGRTNRFGLDWYKPVKILIVGTLLIYIISLPLISNQISYCVDLNNYKNTIHEFLFNIDIFIKMFNPIRNIDLPNENKIHYNIFTIIDLFHRIFVGIMIFQIVRAFRKFFSN